MPRRERQTGVDPADGRTACPVCGGWDGVPIRRTVWPGPDEGDAVVICAEGLNPGPGLVASMRVGHSPEEPGDAVTRLDQAAERQWLGDSHGDESPAAC